MKHMNWRKFLEVTKQRKPTSFLVEVVEKAKVKNGLALDLGCGAGVDAKYLAENGFLVTAIDSDKNSISFVKSVCKGLPVKAAKRDIKSYKINSNSYNMIISWNALPFLKKRDFIKTLLKIQRGLKRKGFFVFSLFGPEDAWAKKKPGMSFLTIEELKQTMNEMDFFKIAEEKQKKPSATGKMKFWHLIQGIARRKKRRNNKHIG